MTKRGWDKSPSLSIVFGLSSKTQLLSGSTALISSAFTALLNCAEVGQRNRILTNDRFLSHSLLFCFIDVIFDFIDIEFGKEVLTILNWESLVQLINRPYFYNAFCNDKIHDMTTKGMII